MEKLELHKAFTLIEPGPVTMITTRGSDGRANIFTLTWITVLDWTPRLALCTGPWNFSYEALVHRKECVVTIATADLLPKILEVGTSTGREIDKFARFGLTALPASRVAAPLLGEAPAQIECRVVDHIAAHNIFILEGVAAWHDPAHNDKRLLHAVGDGTFTADGEVFHRRAEMGDKLPPSER
jgi:flavin reductase (DIM6/NTAB) family NADH-FMN oxidoreductase RutF